MWTAHSAALIYSCRAPLSRPFTANGPPWPADRYAWRPLINYRAQYCEIREKCIMINRLKELT
ncbi:hypothetical protein GCM10022405_17420 [Gibbsiella dentisursi]|uniref:Uncharacterized protein n=1 Tax=Gibbsiella dentisursi TaxID=796890 RepID=A0ABP7L090_9GAMM